MKTTSLPKKGKPVEAWGLSSGEELAAGYVFFDRDDAVKEKREYAVYWRRYKVVRVSITELPPERKRRKSL